MILRWSWLFLWQGQICFRMLLHGWKLIQHWVLMYFQVCSNSTYPQHSGERYRTNGPLVLIYWFVIPMTILSFKSAKSGLQSNGVCYCCCVYQHSANNRWIFITGLFQSNQRSVYENEYVRNAAICVLIRISQLVEHPAETNKLIFIERHLAFESRKLLLLFSFRFIYNSFCLFIFLS